MPKSFLESIRPVVLAQVDRLKQEAPLAEWRDRAKKRALKSDFRSAISRSDSLNIIAEIKKASPSRGVIRENFDPPALARIYESHGAAAIAVLTEEKYFLGNIRHLAQVAEASTLPVLRKDFIVDEVQIAQAKLNGAAAVLLIVAFLGARELKNLIAACSEYSVGALVEVHNETEVGRATEAGATIVGVNNRNLKTLEVDVRTAEELIHLKQPHQVFVAESGLTFPGQLFQLHSSGYDAFLIGEHLMKAADPGGELERLRGIA
jgi:indole-3-glycerol phosphate synthase